MHFSVVFFHSVLLLHFEFSVHYVEMFRWFFVVSVSIVSFIYAKIKRSRMLRYGQSFALAYILLYIKQKKNEYANKWSIEFRAASLNSTEHFACFIHSIRMKFYLLFLFKMKQRNQWYDKRSEIIKDTRWKWKTNLIIDILKILVILSFFFFVHNRQVTDTDDADKKKIKIEEASEEIASQPNQSATAHEQSPQNPPRELISSENGQHATLANDSESVAPTSLPPTVITTQRHRMITTTGQIR